MHHIKKAFEADLQFLLTGRFPYKAARKHSGTHIEFSCKIPEAYLSQIEYFSVNSYLCIEPVRRRDHKMNLIHYSPVRTLDVGYIVNAVDVTTAQ